MFKRPKPRRFYCSFRTYPDSYWGIRNLASMANDRWALDFWRFAIVLEYY